MAFCQGPITNSYLVKSPNAPHVESLTALYSILRPRHIKTLMSFFREQERRRTEKQEYSGRPISVPEAGLRISGKRLLASPRG